MKSFSSTSLHFYVSMAMKIVKQFSKFIKPFVPTPQTHRRYKLGLIDELNNPSPVPIVLFYSTDINNHPKKLYQLEKSLEKTLTRLYPLAGKFVTGSHTVDCNDQGVEFIYAKVNAKLEDILVSKNVVHLIDDFIPTRVDESLIATQVTTFECGGVAIGVNASHQIVDGSTLAIFINEWAAFMNRDENESLFVGGPSFNSSALFPGRGIRPCGTVFTSKDEIIKKYAKKKLSFSESVIEDMKVKFMSNGITRLSKVQLVSATIGKALIAIDRANHNYPREAMLFQAINLRGKMSTIPKDSCGNLLGLCGTEPTTADTTEELLPLLKDSVKKSIIDLVKPNDLQSEEVQTMVLDPYLSLSYIPKSTNIIWISSWCNFPFYQVDFGFGKPSWVAPGLIPLTNLVLMIDGAQGNGVEAYLILENKDVPCFEQALQSDRKIFGFSCV